MKILLINTASSTIINFRKDLIMHLQNTGYEVVVITMDSVYKEEIEQLNIKQYIVESSNRSVNVFSNLKYKKEIKKIIEIEKPDIVFSFQAKPNTLGIIAARNVKYKFAMVEGRGDVFGIKKPLYAILRLILTSLYRKSFKKIDKVFFLNNEDFSYFVDKKIIKGEKGIIIKGIGINTNEFNKTPITNFETFIMVSRLLPSKGVMEYCEAAQIVREKGYNYKFLLVGNEAKITKKDIQKYIDNGSIEYLGLRKDVKSLLQSSTVFVLPSYYHEGLPISILEAMAIGRPILTTDSIGCKETIFDEKNGFKIKVKDPHDLADKMITIMKDVDLINKYGDYSRYLTESIFEQSIINILVLSEMNKCIDKGKERK